MKSHSKVLSLVLVALCLGSSGKLHAQEEGPLRKACEAALAHVLIGAVAVHVGLIFFLVDLPQRKADAEAKEAIEQQQNDFIDEEALQEEGFEELEELKKARVRP